MKRETPAVMQYEGEDRYCWMLGRKHGEAPATAEVLHVSTDGLPASMTGRGGHKIRLGLPSSQLVIRILDLPLVEDEEIAGAVALQADKFSPFPIEQMVYSHEVLARREDGTRVLVAAAQYAWVEEVCAPIRSNGGVFTRLDATALGYWEAMQRTDALKRDRRQVLVLLSQQEVLVLLHDEGQLIGLSGLGQPEDLQDAEACRELADEVSRIVLEGDATFGVSEEAEVVLVPDASFGSMDTLSEAVAEATRLTILPAGTIPFPDGLQGLVVRAERAEEAHLLNLMPSAWLKEAQQGHFRQQLYLLLGWVGGLWLLLALGGWGFMVWQERELAQLREEEQSWREPANDVRRMRLQVTLIDRYEDRTRSALECLREVSMLLPEGVELTSWTYRKGDRIELIGEADRGDLVLQFNERLNGSALFTAVQAGTRTRTRQGRHRFSFDLLFAAEEAP